MEGGLGEPPSSFGRCSKGKEIILISEAAQFPSVCRRQVRAGRPRRAFTALEIIIAVLALGIIATLVIPQFTRASQQSKQNALKDVLQYLRTQITVFKAQH